MTVLNWLRFIFPKIFGVKSPKICELPPSGHFLCPWDITIRLVSETTISLKTHQNWIFWRGKLYRFSETMKQSKPTPSGAIPCWRMWLFFLKTLVGSRSWGFLGPPQLRHPLSPPRKIRPYIFRDFHNHITHPPGRTSRPEVKAPAIHMGGGP